jgi:S1-C subfamily serine protease
MRAPGKLFLMLLLVAAVGAHGESLSPSSMQELAQIQKQADSGDAAAQSKLGVMYYYGKGVPKNVVKAAEWYLKAAVQGNANAQFSLGLMYDGGEGVSKDAAKAVEWFQKAAAQGLAGAQYDLARMYVLGEGVPKDAVKAVEWWQKAAAQGDTKAQFELGFMYGKGEGVSKDTSKAVEWYQKAAAQGHADAQFLLGIMYGQGEGVPQDYVMAHMWLNLASVGLTGKGRERAVKARDLTDSMMSRSQVTEAQRLAREWRPKQSTVADPSSPPPFPRGAQAGLSIESTGTGFIVSKAGHVLTNHHVIDGCKEVRAQIPAGKIAVTHVVARDSRNDLALVKFSSPVVSVATFRDGRTVRQGDSVVTVGFPLHGVLASGANLTTGTVSALAGVDDDTRFLQISAPVQPGNSGGPLLDLSGNVVGVVVGKLNAIKMANATGDIPQNVNFAINAAVVRGFLDAKGVKYETAPSNKKLEAADVGELAKKFTVVVECWK